MSPGDPAFYKGEFVGLLYTYLHIANRLFTYEYSVYEFQSVYGPVQNWGKYKVRCIKENNILKNQLFILKFLQPNTVSFALYSRRKEGRGFSGNKDTNIIILGWQQSHFAFSARWFQSFEVVLLRCKLQTEYGIWQLTFHRFMMIELAWGQFLFSNLAGGGKHKISMGKRFGLRCGSSSVPDFLKTLRVPEMP